MQRNFFMHAGLTNCEIYDNISYYNISRLQVLTTGTGGSVVEHRTVLIWI